MVWAAEEGHLDIIKYLETLGANDYEWAIKLAETRNQEKILEYLIPKINGRIIKINKFN